MDGRHRAGGSRTLAELLEKAGTEIYADLLSHYGVNVSGVVADPPEISPSEVLALIENLPAGSAALAVVSGVTDSVGWTTETYLIASLIDAVKENTFANMQVRVKKRLQRPERTPVPGMAPAKKKNSFVAMAQAQFRAARGA